MELKHWTASLLTLPYKTHSKKYDIEQKSTNKSHGYNLKNCNSKKTYLEAKCATIFTINLLITFKSDKTVIF